MRVLAINGVHALYSASLLAILYVVCHFALKDAIISSIFAHNACIKLVNQVYDQIL